MIDIELYINGLIYKFHLHILFHHLIISAVCHPHETYGCRKIVDRFKLHYFSTL